MNYCIMYKMNKQRLGSLHSSEDAIIDDLQSHGIIDTNGIGNVSVDFREYIQTVLHKCAAPNVRIKTVGIDKNLLTRHQAHHLAKIYEFLYELSIVYIQKMQAAMEVYATKNANFTPAIHKKMISKGYDAPRFTIYTSNTAHAFLQSEVGFDSYKLAPDSFMVNFNLPAPIARFFYRTSDLSPAQKITPDQIEWGYFYRACLPVVWSAIEHSTNFNVAPYRINNFAQHSQDYYYLWEM